MARLFMKLNKWQKNFLRKTGDFLLPLFLDVLCNTLRISRSGAEFSEKENFVAAFWHSKMVIGWYMLKGNKPAAIVSSSKDGELLSALLKHWKFRLARGSSSKGGKEALKKMVEFASDGNNVGITPDGPKGPAKKMKAGAVITAKKAGAPLLLMGIGYESYWELNSWDRLQIPKPFSRVNVLFSDAVIIDENLNYADTSDLIKDCEIKLNELEKTAEKFD